MRLILNIWRQKNPTANYAAVDRMEKLETSESAIESFVRDGNVQPRGAGR